MTLRRKGLQEPTASESAPRHPRSRRAGGGCGKIEAADHRIAISRVARRPASYVARTRQYAAMSALHVARRAGPTSGSAAHCAAGDSARRARGAVRRRGARSARARRSRLRRARQHPSSFADHRCPIARPHPAQASFRQAGAILSAAFRTGSALADRGGSRCRVDVSDIRPSRRASARESSECRAECRGSIATRLPTMRQQVRKIA